MHPLFGVRVDCLAIEKAKSCELSVGGKLFPWFFVDEKKRTESLEPVHVDSVDGGRVGGIDGI